MMTADRKTEALRCLARVSMVLLLITGGAGPTIGDESLGGARFAVDGVDKLFEHVEPSTSYYTPLASSIDARPSPAATESLSITLMSVDLKGLELPVDLPAPRGTAAPGARAMVGFSYTDAEGDEWAGPGRIRIDSFDRDGTLRGEFGEVTLPHTDKERPEVTLTGGSFEARITKPW